MGNTKIWVDFTTEARILPQASVNSDAHRKAKKKQFCFLIQDQTFWNNIEKILRGLYSHINAEKEVGLVLLIPRLLTHLTKAVDIIANCLDKFDFNINGNDNILQWVDHNTSFKHPNKFFNNNRFIDLNDKPCQSKEDNMFKPQTRDPQQLHTWILDA